MYQPKNVRPGQKKNKKKWDLLAYQIDEDTWLGYKTDKEVYIPEIQEYLVNHSCDGNCWYDENDDLIAMRDISKGEELTYDYALTESESLWMLGDHGRCMCGTSKCRGLIRGNDYLLPELQVRYKGHFHAYINKRIEVLTLKHTQEQTEEAKERLETQQESQQTTKQQQQQPQQQQPQQEQQQTTKSESAASSSSSSAASSTTALSSSSSSDSSTSSTTCT